MALNEEYIRKIEFLQNNLTKRMYSVLGNVDFRAFFTYDRLTLDEASRERLSRYKAEQDGAKSGSTAGFLQKLTCRKTIKRCCLWQTWANVSYLSMTR